MAPSNRTIDPERAYRPAETARLAGLPVGVADTVDEDVAGGEQRQRRGHVDCPTRLRISPTTTPPVRRSRPSMTFLTRRAMVSAESRPPITLMVTGAIGAPYLLWLLIRTNRVGRG